MAKRYTKSVRKGLFKVEWFDALGEHRADKEMIFNAKSKDLMKPLCVTSAMVIIEDNYGVILITEDAGDYVDYTVIPKGWYNIIEGQSDDEG